LHRVVSFLFRKAPDRKIEETSGSRAIGAVRKKAIVAVARRLAVDLWRLHTGRCSAEQLGLKF